MERLCKVLEADIVGIPQVGNVLTELFLEDFQKSFWSEVCPAAVGVMHDRDIVDVEEMARNADRSLCATGSAAAGDDDRKNSRVGADTFLAVIADELEHFAGIDLAG